jgi:hypothetical protein
MRRGGGGGFGGLGGGGFGGLGGNMGDPFNYSILIAIAAIAPAQLPAHHDPNNMTGCIEIV